MAQSTICADTGNTALISFGAGITDTLKVRRIMQPEQSIGKIECSDLSTTGEKKFISEDLTDPVEIEVEWLWDTFHTPPTVGLNLATVTITYPTRTGETTPATRAGSAFVSAVKHPDLANNELQVGTMKIQFDGVSAVAYTKST